MAKAEEEAAAAVAAAAAAAKAAAEEEAAAADDFGIVNPKMLGRLIGTEGSTEKDRGGVAVECSCRMYVLEP